MTQDYSTGAADSYVSFFCPQHGLSWYEIYNYKAKRSEVLLIFETLAARVNLRAHSYRYNILDGAANGGPSLHEHGVGNLSLASS